jgi:hypothetical protein
MRGLSSIYLTESLVNSATAAAGVLEGDTIEVEVE